MAYKKVTKYEMNKVNPFLPETVTHVEKGEKIILMSSKNPDMIVNAEGEVKGHAIFAKRQKIDRAQFAKFYISSLTAFYDLEKSGIKVLSYILKILKPNADSFDFDFEDCMNHTGYKSKKTIFTGLSELLENKFIARGNHPYKYYINPTIFFNGDRITFLKQYEVEGGALSIPVADNID